MTNNTALAPRLRIGQCPLAPPRAIALSVLIASSAIGLCGCVITSVSGGDRPRPMQAAPAPAGGATTDAGPLAVGVPVKVGLPASVTEGDFVNLDIEISFGPKEPSVDDSAPMLVELAYSDLSDWVRPRLWVIADGPVTPQGGEWKRFVVVPLQTRDRTDVATRPSFVIVSSSTMRTGERRIAGVRIDSRP